MVSSCSCADESRQAEEVNLQPIVSNIVSGDFDVRCEAVRVIATMTATASVERIRHLTEQCNVLEPLSSVLNSMDPRVCVPALQSLQAILTVGDSFRSQNEGRNPYADRIELIGGREAISRLRDHICHTVFKIGRAHV